jgi:hypothetical protein
MKVLVCGGRDFDDEELLYHTLDSIKDITLLIHGDAPGADTLADRWAEVRKVPRKAYPAEWARFGRAAGPIRNQGMIDETKPDLDLVVAFPGGRGTEDMIRRALKAGIDVMKVTR